MPEKSRTYQRLLDIRANAIEALKFHQTKANAIEDDMAMEALTRLSSIEIAYDKFNKICEQLERLDEFLFSELVIKNEDVADIYITSTSKLKVVAKDLIEPSLLSSTQYRVNHPQNSVDVKLPKLTVPPFSGDYQEWTTFKDAFNTLIECNTGLSDGNKMSFLKSSLRGNALRVINNMPITDVNYKIAWKALVARFENKRAILNKCLSSILYQPKMKGRNANEIRSLIDTTRDALDCIETLNVPTDEWSPFLVFILQSKMDDLTKSEYERYLGGGVEVPKYRLLKEFLEREFRVLDSSSADFDPPEIQQNSVAKLIVSSTNPPQTKLVHSSTPKSNTNKIQAFENEICPLCKENHWLLNCQQFIDKSPSQRKDFAINNNICIVCLHDHEKGKCKSKYKCKKCQGPHSVKLHTVYDDVPHPSTNVATIQETNSVFATALVNVHDKCGTRHLLRAFIDMGSGGAFVSERAAQLLCLPRKREVKDLTGLDGAPLGTSTTSVLLQVESLHDDYKLAISSNVMRSIIHPRKFPEHIIQSMKHVNDIKLADPDFANPSQIDILLGVDIYGLIIKDGLRKGQSHEPIAQNSHFGWLVLGGQSKTESFSVQINSIGIENQLKKLWENEEVAIKPIRSQEHEQCVKHFEKTHTRLPDGSFMVALPFNTNPNEPNFLGESKKMALCRFLQVEKKMKDNSLYKQRYHEEVNGYLERGHMTLCKNDTNDGYYLPHHAVVRESSTTTKQRTVYDASAKTTNGFSLNDRCLNGPTIQPELVDIFIRWRIYKIALIADIEKMYRMIKVRPEDRKYQKFLWRFSEFEPIQTYELNTVTFGMKPAPYLAIATTFSLADREKHNFPEAAKRTKKEIYVDDTMSGDHSVKRAIELQKQFDGMFRSGGFLLRKWCSNALEVLEHIPIENRALRTSIELNINESIKTLGLVWTPQLDQLSFKIDMSAFHLEKSMTKRQLLSDASKIYDPCGLLSPITIKSKLAMQEVWKSGTEWDKVVPNKIQAEWNTYKNELPLIEHIKIDRWFNKTSESEISLHGFCDASEKAMACVIYLVQKSNDQTTSKIICAKTKVAPLSLQSIPRLELNAALLLAKLMDRTASNLNVSKSSIHLWTDSSIVLTWLRSHASRWLPYVSARIRDIHELFESNRWQHVRTHENLADIASRGVFPSELLKCDMWFHGPKWLIQNNSNWPKLEIPSPPKEKLEMKSNICVNAIQVKTSNIESEILRSFNKFDSLVRTTALIFRFINNCRNKETLDYSKRVIRVIELKRAELFWIKYVQQLHFINEINRIKAGQFVSEKSSIKELNPQLNENGILIVHGRLQYADFSPLRKFPMILPAKSNLSKILVEKAHTRSLHGTIHLTLATLRQEYWVVNARNIVKTYIHKCITCYRQKPKALTQMMAPLPQIKTTQFFSFMHTGMDFAGPFDIKISSRRNATTAKGYVCVFVCMVSKAVHLEPVGDLSTQKFISALRRFISRRGLCTDIYCDQGSNFKGASNELPLLFFQAESESSEQIQSLFANDKIQFHFNPPSAPHWGGQWESFVKLTKHHLNRVSVYVKITFEDMYTLLAQIEACINSRPLCAITSDIDDLDPITAGHLLTGRAINLIPEPSLLSLKDTTLDLFQAVQKGVQTFWKRFYIEYLHTMHPRKKWYKPGEELRLNDLVVIIDDNMPPAKWLMGRVVEMHPGTDGYIRMVTVQTKAKEEKYGEKGVKKAPPTLQRPIAKLCKLPIENEIAPEPTTD